jgi:5-methylcytosine-specific restriction endonuclease McrA
VPTGKRAARYARRRRRRLSAQVQDLTVEQWALIQRLWDDRCAYCGDPSGPLQRDCVLPISRGGRYCATNVVPACASCNASKCNDEVTSWMRRKKLDERAFLLRHAQTLAELADGSAVDDPESGTEMVDVTPADTARTAPDR